MSAALFPRTPPLADADPARSRQRILDYFHRTFDRYEQLFEVLTCDEAYFAKPIALRHPLIFYFGQSGFSIEEYAAALPRITVAVTMACCGLGLPIVGLFLGSVGGALGRSGPERKNRAGG